MRDMIFRPSFGNRPSQCGFFNIEKKVLTFLNRLITYSITGRRSPVRKCIFLSMRQDRLESLIEATGNIDGTGTSFLKNEGLISTFKIKTFFETGY